MSSLRAILRLIGARARRRPGRALLTMLGLAVATAFAGAVAAESTIAGDRAAHAVLRDLSPLARTVRVTYTGLVTPQAERRARSILNDLGLGQQTEIALLNPVRLSGVVVRPAAIAPLTRWARGPGQLRPCTVSACPMWLTSGQLLRRQLSAAGVRISIAGRATLRSAAPLGFDPTQPADQPPVVLTGDVSGLEANPGLSGVYRTHSWIALLPAGALHGWQLAGIEQRLKAAQTTLLAQGGSFSLTAPFDSLDAARSQVDAAPRRLLLAGGGALAAFALFIVLAVGGLRRDVEAELSRLRTAGATARQCGVFTSLEAALLCGAAVLLGAALAVIAGAVEATSAGVPAGAALTHSLLTSTGAVAALAAWLAATALTAVLLLIRGTRIADVVSVAAVVGLALALSRGSSSGSDPLPVLLAPLACLAAGVIVYRVAGAILRGAERLARRGPVMARLAFVDLARAPAAPSLAIAFIAVSTGLGGFALAYRATLERSTADQAADRVPLDAIVSPGSDFLTPLSLAPLGRWRTIAHGAVASVRRTEASYVSGGSSLTLPALGVPAWSLSKLHGWRSSDGSTSLRELARRLVPPGPSRVPGPVLPEGARRLSVSAQARGIGITLTADLRDPQGSVRRVTFGQAGAASRRLAARVPGGGPWELEALELSEPTGLEITNGHQNGENVAASTRFSGTARLSGLTVDGQAIQIREWHAVGAASTPRAAGSGVVLRFAATGEIGLVRPAQPSDSRPVPVLADPQTAATAGRGRQLALTVDGLPVPARVVGVLRRFPTVPASASGFIVADQPTLASALDAQLPGQGQADELWIATRDPRALQRTLANGSLAQLSVSLRSQIQHRLRSAPIASAVLGTLIGATVVSGLLAVIGLLVALVGAARDERVERDLVAQGVGPRTLRRELHARLGIAAIFGVLVGLGIGVLLTRMAVATVRAAGTAAIPRPPIVTVAPWLELAVWALAAAAALLASAWAAARALVGRTP